MNNHITFNSNNKIKFKSYLMKTIEFWREDIYFGVKIIVTKREVKGKRESIM